MDIRVNGYLNVLKSSLEWCFLNRMVNRKLLHSCISLGDYFVVIRTDERFLL